MVTAAYRPRSNRPGVPWLETYLRQIARAPLLTRGQEQDLGRQAHEHTSSGALTAAAHHAQDRLIQCNLRLVVWLAKKFTRYGLMLEDLIQEGNLGLMHAAERFEPGRARFSTYATTWIVMKLRRASKEQALIIRRPDYAVDLARQLVRAEERARLRLGREPTEAEADAELARPPNRCRLARRTRAIAMQALPLGDGVREGTPCQEMLVDPHSLEAPELDAADMTRALAARLSERERQVIDWRFGLTGQRLTLAEAGERLGITRERVRQIERDALAKLRKSME